MDLFTQNMINRTKQRQEQMSKAKYNATTNIGSSENDNGEILQTPSKAFPSNEIVKLSKSTVDFMPAGKENDSVDKSSTPSCDEASPFEAARKNRLEALAYKISDWEDQSKLKQAAFSPEKNPRGTSTPTKPILSLLKTKHTISNTSKSEAQLHASKASSMALSTVSSPKETPEKTKAFTSEIKEASTPRKALVLDKSVLQNLESQGFTPTESRSCLIYEFEKEQENEAEEETAKSWTFATGSPHKPNSPLKSKSHLTALSQNSSPKMKKISSPNTIGKSNLRSPEGLKLINSKPARLSRNMKDTKPNENACTTEKEKRVLSVHELAAQFDSPRQIPKDPTEMTISERKAIFERNKSHLLNNRKTSPRLNPSVQSGTALEILHSNSAQKVLGKKLNSKVVQSSGQRNTTKTSPIQEHHSINQKSNGVSSIHGKYSISSVKLQSPLPEHHSNSEIADVCFANETGHKMCVSQKLAYAEEEGIHAKNHTDHDHMTEPYAGVHYVRPIRVSPPKPGKLYPCLSDIDSVTENESESDEQLSATKYFDKSNEDSMERQDMDSSFTVDILGRAGLSHLINTPKRKLEETHQEVDKPYSRSELGTDSTQEVTDISDLLDEALNSPKQSPKYVKTDSREFKTPENEIEHSLFHSISSYRQQKEKTFTPVKQIVRNPAVGHVFPSQDGRLSSEYNEMDLQHQIRSLQEEITTQQNVMAQACQALNLCRSTAEFSGSTEQVEGEKLLLISTKKKLAAVDEIQRLKSEAVKTVATNKFASRGTLSFSNIGLPLKKEFLNMLLKGGGDIVHYFIMLIRSRGQVIPLQMLSTVDGIQDGLLRFPNLVQLSNLSADFEIAIELYALQTRKEKINHEIKYHIRKESSKMRLTPRKIGSKQESRGMSRTGFNSVTSSSSLRSSSFGLVGITNITPRTLRTREWSLENVPSTSPIDGKLQLKIQSHTESLIEERGFLTIFEDVGGYGAWHRKWCLLSNDQMLFWKYPDEEKIKEPQYTISLRKCITECVDVVSNDVCARPHTFLLETVRPPENDDKDSLVMTCYPHRTALRHLISADLKVERQLWCTQINRVLANLRIWDTETQ